MTRAFTGRCPKKGRVEVPPARCSWTRSRARAPLQGSSCGCCRSGNSRRRREPPRSGRLRLISPPTATRSGVAAGGFGGSGLRRTSLYRNANIRERRADIPPLARHFLQRFGRKAGRRIVGISAAALDAAVVRWPGNVREWRTRSNAPRCSVRRGDPAEDLPKRLSMPPGRRLGGERQLARGVCSRPEQAIVEAFRQAGGSYTEAAARCGCIQTTCTVVKNLGLKARLREDPELRLDPVPARPIRVFAHIGGGGMGEVYRAGHAP